MSLVLFRRASDGSIGIATWHPRASLTWHWAISIVRSNFWETGYRLRSLASVRRYQWHDYYRLTPWHALRISRQDYHIGETPK
jgi:hypothetical protein